MRHGYAYADGIASAYSDGNIYPDTYSNSYLHAYAYSNSYSHAIAYRDGDLYSDSDSDVHANA